LEIPENDITNNVELVCPTNHYSIHTFDSRKPSLILIKREGYFEPIYGYRNDGKIIHVTTTFTEYDPKLPNTLRSVFEKIIKRTLDKKCKPFPSIKEKEYRFKAPPLLDKLINELTHNEYTISFQVLNFQGKVIGVMTKNKKGLEGFIPCYPSSLTNLKDKICEKTLKKNNSNDDKCEYDFVYMNDDIWKTYDETLNFLKAYYRYKKPGDMINFYRVVEDKHITGFLTDTDQFVPIKVPIAISDVDDSIKSITNNNMLVADINTLVSNDVDSERVDFIKKIQLETNFYNIFRNTIRILFNDYLNSEKRKLIKDECNKKYSLYKNKLDTVIELLKDLVQDNIIFASKSKMNYSYKEIDETNLQTCISQTKDKCLNKTKTKTKTKKSICRVTKDKCQLVLPKINLVNGKDNEIFYYGRMADELIRYNRIKSFIFKPQAYLSFGQIKYNLRDDEIIILQDLLTQEFFENLTPGEINRYSKYNTYDTAEPIISQDYNRVEDLDKIINPYHDRDCVKTNQNKIKSDIWRNCFPDNFKEFGYTGSTYCPLYLIIDLVKEIHNNDLNVEKVKDDLIEIYGKLTNNFTNEKRINTIIDILKEEAQIDAKQLRDGMSIEQMIKQDGFIAVNFDLWLLLVNYKIPSIFISSKLIPETRKKFTEFVCYTEPNIEKYVFILVPALYKNRDLDKLPEYKVVINGDDINIDINSINQETNCFGNIKKAISNYITIEKYLDSIFKKHTTTKDIELVMDETREIEVEVTDKNKKKGKKIESTLILKEAEETKEKEIPDEKEIYKEAKETKEKEIFKEKEINIEQIFPNNVTESPKKKRKTRKQREKKIKVNPVGKSRKNKKLLDFVDKNPDYVEIVNR
jgi:hypothetical protein